MNCPRMQIRHWINREGKKRGISRIITRFFECLQLVQDDLPVVVGQLLPALHVLRRIVDPLGAGALFRERVEQAGDVVPDRHQFAVREEARHVFADPYLTLLDRAFAPLAFRAAGFRALHGERFLLLLLLIFLVTHDAIGQI